VTNATKKKIVQRKKISAAKSLRLRLLMALSKEFTFSYIVFTRRLHLSTPSMRTFGYTNQSNFFMKHLKKSYVLLTLLTVIIGSRTFAQDFLSLNLFSKPQNPDRVKQVTQDNEYASTGYELGIFYRNPLMLNGKPLDYNTFNVESKGELTVIKGETVTGKTTQVPFHVYLRRDGYKVLIPGSQGSDKSQIKIDISQILQHAKPGDQLVIEPVNKEDGPAKRILKLLGGNC
jgi:hypothetical protein